MRILNRRLRPGRPRTRGQSLVEFALVLPLMLLIVMFGIDFGRAYLGWVNLQNAARIAANYAGTHPLANWGSASDPDRVRYTALVNSDFATSNCLLGTLPEPTFIDGPDAGNTAKDIGDSASVRLTCAFRFATPFIGAILGNQLTMAADSSFVVRSGEYSTTVIPTPSPITSPSPVTSPSPSSSSSPGSSASTPPSPSPTPSCTIPNFINHRKADAQPMWNAAGFTTTVLFLNGNGNFLIGYQDKVGGQGNQSCTSTTVVVGPPP